MAMGGPALWSVISRAEGETPVSKSSVLRKVPYFSQRSDLDGTLACARMVLSYFEPDEHFPVSDVSDMTFHKRDRWIFDAQLIPILEQKGYKVYLRASTPYHFFSKGTDGNEINDKERAGDLFARKYGPHARGKIDPEALAWAAGYLNEGNFKPSGASLNEALKWFRDGAMVMLSVDRAVLRNYPELPYCRYNIIITGVAGGRIRFHDPSKGPDCMASMDLIEKAFEAPGTDRAVLRVE